jgi:fumarylpyruvate hydrolase
VPAASTGPLASGAITLAVNGQPRQASDVKELIWNVGEIIEHLSAAWRLEPGDLIYTGTPAGVAAVVPGDVMEGRVAGLPALRVAVR